MVCCMPGGVQFIHTTKVGLQNVHVFENQTGRGGDHTTSAFV